MRSMSIENQNYSVP